MTGRLSVEEFARARSWLFEIARALLPADTTWTDAGNGWRRFDHSGGLNTNTRKAVWFRHSDRKSGISPIKLITLLKPGEDAGQWLAAWLAAHEGTGSCLVIDGDGADEVDPVSVARCDRILAEMGPVENTAGERYRGPRGIFAPYPDCVRFIENARTGESALVGILTAHQRITAVQLLFLTPAGKKSSRLPVRIRLNRERCRERHFGFQRRRKPLPGRSTGRGITRAARGSRTHCRSRALGGP
jgi:hypothetical protein